MEMKFFWNLLLFLSLSQTDFYCSHKKLKHAKSIDGASLFFPSNDIKLANVSGRQLAKMKDLRLKSLSEAVYDSSVVPVAKGFYTSALAAEIDKEFDKSDQFAVQGYEAILKSQPYGRLLEQEDSLVYNLWNLLNRCSLGNNTVSLIKRALWQEAQRNLSQRQHITYEDISLLDQISNAYVGFTLLPEEVLSLRYIGNIVDTVKRAEALEREMLQQRLEEERARAIEQERLQRLEEERARAIEEEHIRLQEQEKLQRLEEERARTIEEERRQLKQEELKQKQQEEKIQRFEQERFSTSDEFKRMIRDFVMRYNGQIDDENRSRFNDSLYNCFYSDFIYKNSYFAAVPFKKIRIENIGKNKFFNLLVSYLDKHYVFVRQSAQPNKIVLTEQVGQMEVTSDLKYIRKKGYLILSKIFGIIPRLIDLPKSYLDQKRYNIHVLTGVTQEGDSIQCVILPGCDFIFYQIEKFATLQAAKAVGDDVAVTTGENESLNSSLVSSAGAGGGASAGSSYSVPSLPVWRKPKGK